MTSEPRDPQRMHLQCTLMQSADGSFEVNLLQHAQKTNAHVSPAQPQRRNLGQLEIIFEPTYSRIRVVSDLYGTLLIQQYDKTDASFQQFARRGRIAMNYSGARPWMLSMLIGLINVGLNLPGNVLANSQSDTHSDSHE